MKNANPAPLVKSVKISIIAKNAKSVENVYSVKTAKIAHPLHELQKVITKLKEFNQCLFLIG